MIKDSGVRREFESGAVRDIQEGKGRCDLLPLDVVLDLLYNRGDKCIINGVYNYTRSGDYTYLEKSIIEFIDWFCKEDVYTTLIEVSIHFEDGCKKYGENNWQKGIPTRCYIDSAVRHYFKFRRGDTDEPHDRAFIWNMMCCIWTCMHKPELNDYAIRTTEDEVEE